MATIKKKLTIDCLPKSKQPEYKRRLKATELDKLPNFFLKADFLPANQKIRLKL